ncbi:sensor domain-containing diguanylate cyclase [Sporolactobacillus sp. STSJ-5]|uniref:sensor domain-containing diguanylate cyclase n=1 Tax=Sporolactobacillus sp. STSJ-5 TaxID=2965076 RepID=UPI002106628F|nr:sensor domain-containing diguanylate cyclase [Sporolactobacillus sp. STSJ-5]MCQ2008550.1 sensor domain-containing diguanylate cyclase [Sporolactobacillus sp. STSJ-5]
MSIIKQRVITAIWILTFFFSLPIIYTIDPPRNITPASLLTVTIVFVLTGLFSFKVKGTDIIVLQGIGLATFLIFGFFVETLMTQFCIIVYLLTQKIGKTDAYRIPINLTMFLFVSISSGSTYFALGGKATEVTVNVLELSLLPIFGFYFSAYLANTVALMFIRKWLLSTPIKVKMFDRDSVWEITITLLMMPLGIAFYLMYASWAWLGMLMIAIPMVTLSIIMRQINNNQELIRFLQSVNHFGQQLTEELSVSHVFDLLFEKMPTMLPVDYLYVVLYTQPERPKLVRMYRKDQGEFFVPFQQEADISLSVFRQAKAIIGSGNAGDLYPFLDALSNGQAKSYLSVPMMHRGQVIGVMTLASHMSKSYTNTSRIGIEIVGDFLAISLENAKNFEIRKKESERCPLTDLFNYRYMMKAINKMYNNPSLEVFSIIMMDIDNFKQINDTYGHQNGNAILIGVANRLRKTVGHKGTVARYGGEEFTVLLPGMDRNMCFAIAETIRLAVAAEAFMIFNESENRYDKILVTISLGTSTAPVDATDPSELIYNADHAMYKGAKQQGKNRVARYI